MVSQKAEEVFEETRDHSAMAAKIDDESRLREIGGSIAAFKASSLHSVTVFSPAKPLVNTI